MSVKDFLCPQCKYGYLMRIVKDMNGIPYDAEYICRDGDQYLDSPQGPGGWDGTTCPNFVKRPPVVDNTTITVTNGGPTTFVYPSR